MLDQANKAAACGVKLFQPDWGDGSRLVGATYGSPENCRLRPILNAYYRSRWSTSFQAGKQQLVGAARIDTALVLPMISFHCRWLGTPCCGDTYRGGIRSGGDVVREQQGVMSP